MVIRERFFSTILLFTYCIFQSVSFFLIYVKKIQNYLNEIEALWLKITKVDYLSCYHNHRIRQIILIFYYQLITGNIINSLTIIFIIYDQNLTVQYLTPYCLVIASQHDCSSRYMSLQNFFVYRLKTQTKSQGTLHSPQINVSHLLQLICHVKPFAFRLFKI